MPPECMELWARRFKIKRGQRLALRISLPCRCLDDRAAAACVSQRTVFWMDFGWEKKLQEQPRIRLAWHRVAGLFFSECSRRGKL